ncbi:MAG: glutamyl-tRNA synthetase [Verrucomicrobiota bacterium]|jgi:glutamyl-tRNA synthetase
MSKTTYRGRIAPSPTGYLHAGHAMTFWRAQERARSADGSLALRIEDLDRERCQSEFYDAIIEDLHWFGVRWDEGPDVGGSDAPYLQSERRPLYADAWETLRARGLIYPCRCSRKDVLGAAAAPHDENEEPIYPGTCRPLSTTVATALSHRELVKSTPRPAFASLRRGKQSGAATTATTNCHWRFRVPDGETLRFADGRLGEQTAIAGKDFGDFIVWRKDDVPAYQLAVVVDDAAMSIIEVVRGEDLLMSTFRQLLLYRVLNLEPPGFYHVALVTDEAGKRLAKRHAALSLRGLREAGVTPKEICARYAG